MSDAPPHRVLLVDDNPEIHRDYRKILAAAAPNDAFVRLEAEVLGPLDAPSAPSGRRTFELHHAHQGEEALQAVKDGLAADRPFAVAFVDMRMPPGWDGLTTIRHLRRSDPRLQVVLCTAYSDKSWNHITEALQPHDDLLILKKPFDSIEVMQLAHTLAAKWSMQREIDSRIQQLDTLARDRGNALQAAEQRFAAAFLGGARAYVIVDLPGGVIVQSNPAFRRLVGLGEGFAPQPLAATVAWIDPLPLSGALRHLAAGRTPPEVELEWRDRHGHRRAVRLSASPFFESDQPRALIGLTDISEHRRLEQQLRQSQKMEALGSLAAGIAHDFNNVLTVISGLTSLTQSDDQLPPPLRSQLDHVIHAAEHAASLTRQLLVFSRRQPAEPIEYDPATIATRLRPMLNRLVGEDIELTWHCVNGRCTVAGEVSGFEQILLNLVVNARDAITGPGRIRVEICPIETHPLTANPEAVRAPGGYARLQVADTGAGMTADTIVRIFEPFFTTKDEGRGTGLGLATVYAVVKRHRGWVDVQSEPGQGTTFTVYLPLVGTEVVDSSAPLAPVTDLPQRHLRVLAVEDDPAVRDVLRFMLAHQKVALTVAHDAAEALAAWERHAGRFDLVLADLELPGGRNGQELALDLRRRHPGLAVVIASGYDCAPRPAAVSVPPEAAPAPVFIAKPYNSAGLLMAIERALAAVPAATPA